MFCLRFFKNLLWEKVKNMGYVFLLLFVFFSPTRKLNRRKYNLFRKNYTKPLNKLWKV